jgi:hypothetical protein
LLFLIFLQLVFSDEALGDSGLSLAQNLHQREVILVQWLHLSLSATHDQKRMKDDKSFSNYIYIYISKNN